MPRGKGLMGILEESEDGEKGKPGILLMPDPEDGMMEDDEPSEEMIAAADEFIAAAGLDADSKTVAKALKTFVESC